MGLAIEVNRQLFEHALFGIQNIAQKRTATPVLSNVRIEAKGQQILLFATDYDVSIVRKLEAKVHQEGVAALPAKMLYDIIKKSKGDNIELDVDAHFQGVLKAGNRSRYKLNGMNPDDFPEMTKIVATPQLKVDTKTFDVWVRKTLFAASSEESRATLCGVFFETYEEKNLRFVATDTHRLALMEVLDVETTEGLPAEGVILPRKALQELLKIIGSQEMEITIAVPYVRLTWPDTTFIFRTVDGRFPTYRKVIPEKTGHIAAVDRKGLLEVLDRVSLVVTDRFKGVTLTFDQNTLTVRAKNPEMGEGEEQMTCQYQGDQLEVGFNANYLVEALSQIETQQVEIRLIDDVSPTIMAGEGDVTYLNVIMPMRI